MHYDDIFTYKDGLIYWKIQIKDQSKCKYPCSVGDVAGNVNNRGYVVVNMFGGQFMVHRIVWEIHNGPIPDGMEIDHINHDTTDNRIENLRIVDRSGNMRNKTIDKRNSSGVTGVYYHRKNKKWYAQIMHNKKRLHLGFFVSFDEAAKARKDAELNFGYHKNHGVQHESL